jgi:hypothetical protein
VISRRGESDVKGGSYQGEGRVISRKVEGEIKEKEGYYQGERRRVLSSMEREREREWVEGRVKEGQGCEG